MSKLENDRARVIWCLSLVDQLVDKVLFNRWIWVEIDNVETSVSKTGWAPIPGGYKWLNVEFPDGGFNVAVDKTAWDWTMPGWVVVAYLENKLAQCRDPDQPYVSACVNRFAEVMAMATVRLPDGRLYQQKEVGVMKSGWLLTLSCNSAAQYYQHCLAWYRWHGGNPISSPPPMWAMGDDMLVNFTGAKDPNGRVVETVMDLEGYKEELSKTGCLVKHLEPRKEFAGFTFSETVVEPLYQDKHRFILAHLRPEVEQETLLSYFLLYALVPNYGWLSEVRSRAEFPVGVSFRQWARGILSLDLLKCVPEWTK